jgi:hypothetical protein
VLAYVQESGTGEMQGFVGRIQDKVKKLLKEAWQWDAARDNAKKEGRPDQRIQSSQ